MSGIALGENDRLARIRAALPTPVVVTLLYVGLVRLAMLPVWAHVAASREGLEWQTGVLLGQRGVLGLTLVDLLYGINALLLLYLWVSVRAQIRTRRSIAANTTVGFAGAGLLLLYLSWVLSRLAVSMPTFVQEVGFESLNTPVEAPVLCQGMEPSSQNKECT